LKPKDASKDISEFAEAKNTLVQYILFVLKENVIHQHSKPEDPNAVSNPHQFGPPTDIPRRHRRNRKKLLTCTQETTRAKLERLCSAKLIHGDQKIATRHAIALSKAK
jgi:hypothetical protein